MLKTIIKLGVLSVCFLSSNICWADKGAVELVKKVSMSNFGSYVVRYGNFNGDGMIDILSAQSKNSKITCLTAFTFEGKVLWQVGKPNPQNYDISSDRPVQVYDWNNDGIDDVIVVMNERLKVINGRNGKTIKSVPAKASDSVYIGNFWNGGLKVLLKDRYKKFWIYDRSLRIIYHDKARTGHFPMSIDVNGDSIEELLVGYTLFKDSNRKSSRMWNLESRLMYHSDASDYGDMDGDGLPEIAVADSDMGVLISNNGNILWRAGLLHAQHVVMGYFSAENPNERQVVFADRGRNGRLYCYNKAGELLWVTEPQGYVAMIVAVDGWTGRQNESSILVYRREKANPVMLNGKGEEIADFPIDNLFTTSVSNKQRIKNFAQHFDMLNDAREEVLINDYKNVYLYTNADPVPVNTSKVVETLPNPRVYNASFYTGMQ